MRAIIVTGWKQTDKGLQPENLYTGLDGVAAATAAEDAAKSRAFKFIGRLVNVSHAPLPVIHQPIQVTKVVHQTGTPAPKEEQAPLNAEKREALNDELFQTRKAAADELAAANKAAQVAQEESHQFTLSLLGMNKAQLLEKASELKVTGVEAGTKNSDIIAAILAQRQAAPKAQAGASLTANAPGGAGQDLSKARAALGGMDAAGLKLLIESLNQGKPGELATGTFAPRQQIQQQQNDAPLESLVEAIVTAANFTAK